MPEMSRAIHETGLADMPNVQNACATRERACYGQPRGE